MLKIEESLVALHSLTKSQKHDGETGMEMEKEKDKKEKDEKEKEKESESDFSWSLHPFQHFFQGPCS